MPVWKYRSAEEMPEAWMMNRDVPVDRRIQALMSLATLSEPLNMPRGVRKFRSSEEMAAERGKYESARITRIRAKNTQK
jgi:hypothetical protein